MTDLEVRTLVALIRSKLTRSTMAPIAEKFMEADAKFAEAAIEPSADPSDRVRAVARLRVWL